MIRLTNHISDKRTSLLCQCILDILELSYNVRCHYTKGRKCAIPYLAWPNKLVRFSLSYKFNIYKHCLLFKPTEVALFLVFYFNGRTLAFTPNLRLGIRSSLQHKHMNYSSKGSKPKKPQKVPPQEYIKPYLHCQRLAR
jgi:hypothetical protein